MTPRPTPAEHRQRCEVCGRSVSERSSGIYDGRGCLWCRGEPEEGDENAEV